MSSGEQQTLCLQMVDEIEPSVRYCNYQLSRKGGAAVDPAQLLELAGGAGDLLQVSPACCAPCCFTCCFTCCCCCCCKCADLQVCQDVICKCART